MNKNNFENYYQILGLPDFASIEEVKKAFRELAKKHHPDRGGDPEKFKKILKAYLVLSNKKKKKQFDEYLLLFRSKIKQDLDSYQTTQNYSYKEELILDKSKTKFHIKSESIWVIIFFIFWFVLPIISGLLMSLKNETVNLIIKVFWGIVTMLIIGIFGGLFFLDLLGNLFKNRYINLIIKILISISMLIFCIWYGNFIINDVWGKFSNKDFKNYPKPNKNSFYDKTKNKTISYEDAIENYWDDIKEYVDGYATIEACSDSGCYDLEAHISNGKIDSIDFPNGGYLYFDADINSNGKASDMDQNGNWWDFSVDMNSSIINNAVSDWASDNGFEIY
jgi:curved DNA-binding protein CbpA